MSSMSVTAAPNVAFNVTSTSYKEKMSREQLYTEIGKVDKPSVIFWYMCKNLFQKGANYYKKDLEKIQPSAEQCYLCDLTAWAATDDKAYTILSSNPNADRINALALPKICCIKASAFFTWLQNCKGPQLEYIRKVILSRNFIYKLSADKPLKGITIGELFQNKCPALEALYKMDAVRVYSALQYLEGLYLVQTMVERRIATTASKVINVVFSLFNNEADYYRDPEDSFAKDLKAMLQMSVTPPPKDSTVNVMFYNVNYGTRSVNGGVTDSAMGWRPYAEESEIVAKLESAQQIFVSQAEKIAAKAAAAQAARAAREAADKATGRVRVKRIPNKPPQAKPLAAQGSGGAIAGCL